MKLSALLLTFVIALGLASPLEAKTKYKKPKPGHHPTTYKAPKVKKHPSKMKKMKFRKPKTANRNHVKPAKVSKSHTPKSV
jgi:hypothetical protein